MSADRICSWSGTPTKMRKVYRLFDAKGDCHLYGFAGRADEGFAYMHWMLGKIPEPHFTELHIIVINNKKQIWCRNESMLWLPNHKEHWALGSGADYALGAMAMGATSREAVKVATGLDVNTGLGIDTVKF